MKKFYISASTPHTVDKLTLYALEGNALVDLGNVEQLVHIKDDIYQAGNSTLLIKDKQVSVLSADALPRPIVREIQPQIPEWIKRFADTVSVAKTSGPLNSSSGLLYDKYMALVAEFSYKEFENLVKNAIVLLTDKKAQLLIKNEDGVYREEPNIINLRFYDEPAFIYHGGVYVKDGAKNAKSGYVRIEPRLLFAAANYMIFWCGDNKLFAIRSAGDVINIEALGHFDNFVPTKVSLVLKLQDEVGCDVLYNLGNDLQEICCSSDDTRCTIEESGRIVREYEVVYDGVPYPETIVYNFVDGQYKS
ncbi:MAG: hypothetical protein J6X42_01215 [Alphaproteobacteria bacterium]|nr:hypothetical protein [Alphaproteobacteria bacterium]